MSDNKELNVREKGDLSWRKQRLYQHSAELRGGMKKGTLFNSDMAEDILEAYETEVPPDLHELSGNEFTDRPPTAVGKKAFAVSFAKMMRIQDELRKVMTTEKDLPDDENTKLVLEWLKKMEVVLGELVDGFLAGCRMNRAGEAITDKELIRKGRITFEEKRKEYEILVVEEKRRLGRLLMENIRKEKGLSERMDSGLTGEDEEFERLVAACPEKAEEHREEIEAIRQKGREVILEIAERNAGKEALLSAVKEQFYDPAQEENNRRVLMAAYADYAYDLNRRIGELLYIREATVYLLRWLLLEEPVDEIMAEKIGEISDIKPGILNERMHLDHLPGFVEPTEQEYVKVDTVEEVYRLGKEIRNYLFKHPRQFDSQCLLSLTRDTEDMDQMLANTWGILKGMDRISDEDDFSERPQKEQEELFEIWVMADMMGRVGYQAREFVMKYQKKSVREATDALRKLLPKISYTEMERTGREALKRVIIERSQLHVH